MKSSAIVQLLSKLTRDELVAFEDFIKSPYFNRKARVSELFLLLKKHHPEFDSEELRREKIFSKLYPGKTFNYGVLKNLLHELNKLAERFLAIRGFEGNEFGSLITLSKELVKRELFVAGEKVLKNASKIIDEEAVSASDFRNLLKLETARYYQDYFRSADKDFSKKRLSENYLKREHYLTQHYRIELSDLLGEMISENMIYKEKIPVDVSRKVLDFFEKNLNSKNPAIRLRAYKLMLELNNSDYDHYKATKALIKQNETFLKTDKEFAYNFFITLLNFAMYRLLEGNDKYYEDLTELFKKLTKLDILDALNKVPLLLFREVLKVCVKTGEYEFAEEFFDKFSNKIETESIESEYSRFRSQVHFSKCEYEKSLEHLAKVKFGDVNLKWSIHVLKIKNYFELGKFAELYDAINAARQFIRYNIKMMEKSYESREAFLKSVEKIAGLISTDNKKDAGILVREISGKDFVDRNWCIEKLNRLI